MLRNTGGIAKSSLWEGGAQLGSFDVFEGFTIFL